MTIKFYKVQFTCILPKDVNEVIFNPSISHWKDNLYLCTFRVFSRYPTVDSRKYSKNPLTNPNHPWLGSIEAWPLWWNSVYGYDKTRIVLLKIDEKLNVTFEKDYGDVNGVDGRLLKIDYDKFIFMYNEWLETNIHIKSNKTCKDGCMLLGTRIFYLVDGELKKSTGKLLCPEKSNTIEKNWSMWVNKDESLKISYGLSPVHEIFSMKIKNNSITCEDIKNIRGTVDFFNKLESYYNNNVIISLTSPALLENGKFIGVGHLKYKYRNITYEEVNTNSNNYLNSGNKFTVKLTHNNSNLIKFHNNMVKNGKKFHPLLVYMMFIYEFESTHPYDITRVSPMFIPKSDYTLCFPTNLTYSHKLERYIISYGDHDTACNMLVMTSKEINDSLEPIVKPRDVRFMMVN